MDLQYVNSLVDKYNNLVFAYKLGHIFRIEQRIPHGLNKVIVENVGKLMTIKINRLRAYAEQMSNNNEEDVIDPPLKDGEHPIKVFHRYVGSEELTDLGVHDIMVLNNLAQINDDRLFPEDAVYKQYPWEYRILINELKERYIVILSDNSGIWEYDEYESRIRISSGSEEIPSYSLPLLSVNGTVITSLYQTMYRLRSSINFSEDWDVSNVTSLYQMFYESKIPSLDLSGWDVSNVTTLNRMFDCADVSDINTSGWNVPNVEDVELMFYGAVVTNLNLSGWNVSKVINMYKMFAHARVSNLDISGWGGGCFKCY